MTLIELECPNCGAALEYRDDKEYCFCSFCGTKLLIDREKKSPTPEEMRRSGEQFERGRMDAYEKGAEPELVRKVGSLIRPLREMETVASKRKLCELRQQSLGEQIRKLEQSTRMFLIAPVIFVSVFLLCAVMMREVPWFFIGLLLAALSFAIPYLIRKLALYQLKREKEQADQDYENEDCLMKKLLGEHDFSILPPRYQRWDVAQSLHSILTNRRAFTLNQAFRVFEEEQARERTFALQQEQLELQRAQLQQMEEQNLQLSEQIELQKAEQAEKKKKAADDDEDDDGNSVAAAIAVKLAWKALRRII